jgi:hypothetical protein
MERLPFPVAKEQKRVHCGKMFQNVQKRKNHTSLYVAAADSPLGTFTKNVPREGRIEEEATEVFRIFKTSVCY